MKKAIKNLILDKDLISVSYDVGWKKLWKMRFKNPLDDAETFKINKQKNILEIGKKQIAILIYKVNTWA